MYANGEGTPKNYTEAMKWYTKAANQGYLSAQNNLGNMYGKGEGVPKDLIKAYVWHSIASANGNEISKKNLEILSSEMTPQQVDQAQNEATELWEKINKSKK